MTARGMTYGLTVFRGLIALAGLGSLVLAGYLYRQTQLVEPSLLIVALGILCVVGMLPFCANLVLLRDQAVHIEERRASRGH